MAAENNTPLKRLTNLGLEYYETEEFNNDIDLLEFQIKKKKDEAIRMVSDVHQYDINLRKRKNNLDSHKRNSDHGKKLDAFIENEKDETEKQYWITQKADVKNKIISLEEANAELDKIIDAAPDDIKTLAADSNALTALRIKMSHLKDAYNAIEKISSSRKNTNVIELWKGEVVNHLKGIME